MKRRIKGKFQFRKPNSAKDRKYISYEDAPLREVEQLDPTPDNLTKKFLKVFLILFIAVVAVLAIVNIDYLTPENISHWFQYDLLGKTEGNGYPVRIVGTSINKENIALMDNNLLYCSDTSVVVLNSNAGEIQNNQHSMANPVLRSSSGYSVIYNSEAPGFKIISPDSIVYSGNMKNKIFSADIVQNGTYAILTYGEDYLSVLDVFKYDNSKKYTYSFADYYVNNVSLNKDGTGAVLSGVSAKNGGMISVIYILDFRQENYLQKYEVEDSYIYDIKYMNNGNVLAVGSRSAYFINVEEGSKKNITYDSRTLTTYTFKRDYGLILSLSKNPDGRDCDIVSVTADGKDGLNIVTANKVLSMDYKGDSLAVLFPGEIVIYDRDQNRKSSVTVASDSRKICMQSENDIYALGKSEIAKFHPVREKQN